MRIMGMPYLRVSVFTAPWNSVPLSVVIWGIHPNRHMTSCHRKLATSSDDFLANILASSHPVKSSRMSTMYSYPFERIPISTKSMLNFRRTEGTHVGLILTFG